VQEYGQRKPEDPGSLLTLKGGQEMKDLLFRLIPSAVISGRVLNEDGEPQAWMRVFALRQKYSDGKRRLASEAQFETNDLGEYRLFGLRPGRYFIKAVQQQDELAGARQANGAEVARGQQGYGTTYYPSATDSLKASTFTVKAGEEIARRNRRNRNARRLLHR
jgi:uncharacterized protein (DUF2141 family)